MSATVKLSRAEQVGHRRNEFVQEALAMVSGASRMLPDSRHLAALVMAMEEAERRAVAGERDAAVARQLAEAREKEALVLAAELSDHQQLLAGFQEVDRPHLFAPDPAKGSDRYRVVRHYIREYAFSSWGEAKAYVRPLWENFRTANRESPKRAPSAGEQNARQE